MGPMFRNLFLREMVVIRVYRDLVETRLHGESSRIFLEGSGALDMGPNSEIGQYEHCKPQGNDVGIQFNNVEPSGRERLTR